MDRKLIEIEVEKTREAMGGAGLRISVLSEMEPRERRALLFRVAARVEEETNPGSAWFVSVGVSTHDRVQIDLRTGDEAEVHSAMLAVERALGEPEMRQNPRARFSTLAWVRERAVR